MKGISHFLAGVAAATFVPGVVANAAGGGSFLIALGGLLIAIPATAIGLIPSLFGSRRMNCLGVLLIPITLNMAGIGASIAHGLGLI